MIPRRVRLAGLAALLGAALLFPLLTDNLYLVGVAISAFITAIAVYGLNVLVGYAGQLSLAHAGFYGIGGYTTGILMVNHGVSFWLALPAAVAVTCVIGYLAGTVALRTRGSYFAIFTLALGVIVTIVIERWESLTGGTDGLIGVPPPTAIGPLRFDTLRAQYYLVLAFLLAAMFVSARLANSLVGRTMLATRNSEDLARTIGIDVMAARRLAFVLSVGFAGVAGALYATYLGYIGPGMSSLAMTFSMLLFLMLGGAATLAGPLVGTVLISVMMQTLQSLEEYQLVILGPVLVLIMIFFPTGLAGIWGAIERRWFAARHSSGQGEAPRAEPAR